jgi:hypothetical protein
MLLKAETLKPGSIIFVRHEGIFSRLIRWLLGGFPYSHVAFYLGIGLLLESDVGGVQVNPISQYIDNDKYVCEIVNPPLRPEQVDAMSRAMLEFLKDRYDYSLLFGNALNKLILKCNKNWATRLFDQSRHWICSELIAEGFRQIGVRLPKPVSCMNPKDIYNLLQEELHYE